MLVRSSAACLHDSIPFCLAVSIQSEKNVQRYDISNNETPNVSCSRTTRLQLGVLSIEPKVPCRDDFTREKFESDGHSAYEVIVSLA